MYASFNSHAATDEQWNEYKDWGASNVGSICAKVETGSCVHIGRLDERPTQKEFVLDYAAPYAEVTEALIELRDGTILDLINGRPE